ncbi:MAG: hypothetical protein ABJK39_05000 [Hyphomicrobiales bacterium]
MAIQLPDRTKFVEHSISTDDNVLIIRLTEPLDIDIERHVEDLPDYVLVGRRDPEGGVLRFALNAGVRVNTMAAGEHLFVDFLARNWLGPNPSIPEEIVRKLEDRAEAALELAEQNAVTSDESGIVPKFDVRVGRHPTFTRFVFNWNVPYSAAFKREEDNAILEFDRKGAFDFAPINADPPALVKLIHGSTGDDTTTVKIKLDAKSKVRSYADGETYIIDITNEKLAGKNDNAVSIPLLIGGLPSVPEGAEGVSFTENNSGERELAELPVAPTSAKKEKADSTDSADKKQADSSSEKATSPTPEETAKKETARDRIAKSKGLTIEQEQALDGLANADSKHNPEAIDKDQKKIEGLSAVEATLNPSKDALRLVFPFDDETPTSVFRRDKAVWIVVKTANIIDVSAIETLLGDFIRSIDVVEKGDYKAIRIGMPSAQLASSAVEGNNWVISIGNSVIRASEPLSISRGVDEKGGLFLQVPLKGAAGIVEITDPVVGDTLHILLAHAPARGLLRAQSFVKVEMLPSAHAFAVATLASDIKVKRFPDRVEIFSTSSLNLSPVKNLRSSASGKSEQAEWYDLPLEYDPANHAEPATFLKQEGALIKAVISSEKNETPQAQMQLAKFYVANNYGPEALAVLDRAIKSQPLLENKRLYVLMKAASQIAMARHEDALNTLAVESYSKDQDAAVWRTIAAAGANKWEITRNNAALGRTKLSAYDADTKQAFFLAAANAALQLNDLNDAKLYLSNVILRNAKDIQRGKYEVLQGELALAEGRLEDARFFFNRAKAIDDIRVQADARLHLAMLNHETGKANNQETIDELEAFAAVWRNDNLELKALRFLGKVLAVEKNYRRAFQLVETASISDNESPITRNIQDDMKELFIGLFHGGKADDLESVDALSLYYDFRNLMPIGRIGDEIVRNLARRLIDLDLLPQAAELLEHQVEKRLNGVARARVAADLAVVQLLDNKPHRALTTLQKSRSASLPASLRRQRRLVEAYALSEISRFDVALELLDPLSGDDVNRMRANVNWDARRWSDAGELLEKAHARRWSDVAPLEAHERLDIMRAAIAFALASDDFALNRLNQKFSQKMSESTDAGTFNILTKPLANRSFERDVAVDSILNIGTTDSFLRDYRKRYLTPRVRQAKPRKDKPATPAPAAQNDNQPAENQAVPG